MPNSTPNIISSIVLSPLKAPWRENRMTSNRELEAPRAMMNFCWSVESSSYFFSFSKTYKPMVKKKEVPIIDSEQGLANDN